MDDRFEALLASLQGGAVLAPADLAAAVVEGRRAERMDEAAALLRVKPRRRIPPRYESEVRTWLARALVDSDPAEARIQAYAAAHLDPHNTEALAALDAALVATGGDTRENTLEALVRTYPDIAAVRDAAASVGIPPPPARPRPPRTKGRPERSPEAKDSRGKKKPKGPRPTGLASLVPALEGDPVRADRLAVVHLALGNLWSGRGSSATEDPLAWATARIGGGEPPAAPERAADTALFVALSLGEVEAPGPAYAKLIKHLRAHPAVVAWAARRQLDIGDARGARLALERLEGDTPAYTADLAPLADVMAMAAGDTETGLAAWRAGELPGALRAGLAAALLEAGNDSEADEVLGLPDVPAAEIGDPDLLAVRFDVMFGEGDVEDALEQAERLALVAPHDAGAVGRIWLALAAAGRLDDLAGRAGGDAESVGRDAAAVAGEVRGLLEAWTTRVTRRLAVSVAALRSDVQQLAKGSTIKDAALFTETAGLVRKGLGELRLQLAPLASLEAEYPAGEEDVVTFLASSAGRRVSLAGDAVRVGPAPGPVPDDPVVALLIAPARDLRERAPLVEACLDRCEREVTAAVTESERPNLAGRRLELRVSRRAREAAAALNTLLGALDLGEAAPELGPELASDDDADVSAAPPVAPLVAASGPTGPVPAPAPTSAPEVGGPAPETPAPDPLEQSEAPAAELAGHAAGEEAPEDPDARWWRRGR